MTDRAATATNPTSATAGSGLWIALIAGLTVIGSYGFACVAPFAAVAALAALTLNRTEGLILVIAAWLINQAVGFLLLSYPHTADTYTWGAAIGAASLFGYLAATTIVPRLGSTLPGIVAAFAAAFAVYQFALYAFGVATSYAGDSFSLAVVGEVLAINAVAYIAFLVIHRIAVALALVKPAQNAATASA
ncbi:hypothetical protein [Hyphomicrobium sp. CS1GBMeth3]|uniref:hypothetical protein n=1 Tax=Hyphomicrobium sp. CS1GBMeth3 TaxID=1892845 RepID=UPI0009303B3C|nr:hypothetical protein [Hyphomicrobium sp. CS1GBMeth3]